MIKIKIEKCTKLKTRYSAYVSFNYNSEIVNVLRSLPNKFYDPGTKSWEIPIDKIEYLKQNLNQFEFLISDDENILNELNKKVEIPKEFEFKTKPYKHQLQALEYGLNHDKWFLGDSMGLGKSKQAIDIAVCKKLLYAYKHCLIVCGVNTLKWNWVNEIAIHSNEQSWILGQKTLKNGKVRIGSTKDKIMDLNHIDDLPYFIITNIESFRDKDIANTVKQLCDKDIINMCVADEFHKMKAISAVQTKGFLKCKPETRIAMTGTPLMNNPLDLYTMLKWLDQEQHSAYQFKNHYCIMGGFGGYEVIGYRNMEQLTNQLNEIKLRRLKEEVFDLPEKTYVDEYVDMLPKQNQLYKEIQCDIKMNLDNIKMTNNPLAELIRLRQCTGYTGILSSTIKESAKLDRMCDIVEEAIENDQKVIIFSNWTSMTDIISKKILEMGWAPCVITGNTKDEDRQLIVQCFQTRVNNPVIIGTIGAMGTGLTLTAATVVIFMDEPWSMALYNQAVDRAHRIGQNQNVTIYNILCKNTIDEKIHSLIYEKGKLSDMIVDGKGKMSNSELLDYLLS